ARPRRFQRCLGRWPVGGGWCGDTHAGHGAGDLRGGAPFPAGGEAMDRHRRRGAQSDLARGDRGGDRHARRAGGDAGLGRRCAGGPGLRLPGGALAARPAAHLPDDDRRAQTAVRRSPAPAILGRLRFYGSLFEVARPGGLIRHLATYLSTSTASLSSESWKKWLALLMVRDSTVMPF